MKFGINMKSRAMVFIKIKDAPVKPRATNLHGFVCKSLSKFFHMYPIERFRLPFSVYKLKIQLFFHNNKLKKY